MAAKALLARRAENLEAEAVARLEGVEREAALRECLAEPDLSKVDGEAFERALGEARSKGCNELLLEEAQARFEEWLHYQALLHQQAKGVQTWIVANPKGFVNIRTEPVAGSPVLGTLEPGEVIRGHLEGYWIKLVDRPGFMLQQTPDGLALLDRFQGDSMAQGGRQESSKWVVKFLQLDRLARECFVFLAPEFHNEDFCTIDVLDLGGHIADLGQRLYGEGSLPGNPTWEEEESPEFVKSIELWREAMAATSCAEFDQRLQKAAELAEEAYEQMGNLAPRMASLRWNCCLRWLAARSEAVTKVSTGASFGTMSPQASDAASRSAKHAIFGWLRNVCKEYEVLAMFDFDIVGNGVWHDGRREPLPKRAVTEWYRRSIEFDIVKMCHQAARLPPEDINASAPTFTLVQPYLTPDWILPVPESIGHIIRKHGWIMEWFHPQIDDLHTKALVQGPVLHIEQPPEHQHDFGDPEVVAKVQRGEDLGKGPQADGRPGAIHASMALLFAAFLSFEKVRNLRVYSGLLELEGFFETLLKHGPPLSVLELVGAGEAATEGVLRVIANAGPSLRILDLSECAMDGVRAETLIEVLEALPNVKHVDLSDNCLDGQAALSLVASLCERRIDIPSIRLDGNPLGDTEELRNQVAQYLAARGEQVVAGGEIILHLEGDMLRWFPSSKDGTLAQRMGDESALPPQIIAIKEMRNMANAKARRLDKYEKEVPAAKSSGGRDWLRRQREVNQKVLQSHLIEMYRAEIQHRVAMKKAAEKEREERALAQAS